MSQELAQDEGEAEDYEFGNLNGSRPVQAGDEDDDEDEQGGLMGKEGYSSGRGGIRLSDDNQKSRDGDFKNENVVFALEDDDSDVEGDIGRTGRETGGRASGGREGYDDMESDTFRGKGKYD